MSKIMTQSQSPLMKKTKKQIIEEMIDSNEIGMAMNEIRIRYFTRQKISSLGEKPLMAIENIIKRLEAESQGIQQFNQFLKEILDEKE